MRERDLVQICRIFDVIRGSSVDDVMDWIIRGQTVIHAECVDPNPLDFTLLNQKKGCPFREPGEVQLPGNVLVFIAIVVIPVLSPPGIMTGVGSVAQVSDSLLIRSQPVGPL